MKIRKFNENWQENAFSRKKKKRKFDKYNVNGGKYFDLYFLNLENELNQLFNKTTDVELLMIIKEMMVDFEEYIELEFGTEARKNIIWN